MGNLMDKAKEMGAKALDEVKKKAAEMEQQLDEAGEFQPMQHICCQSFHYFLRGSSNTLSVPNLRSFSEIKVAETDGSYNAANQPWDEELLGPRPSNVPESSDG